MHRLILVTIFLVTLASSAASIPVVGTVDVADGSALPGARVTLRPLPSNFSRALDLLSQQPGQEPAATATTDAAGRFSFNAPAAGLFAVMIESPGRVPMRYAPFVLVAATQLPPVTLLRDAGGGVAVTDATGEPAGGISIHARSASPAVWRHATIRGWRVGARLGRTDAGGRLALPRAHGEKLVVSAYAPGNVTLYRAFEVEQGALRLAAESCERPIEIRDEHGRAAAGLVVAAGDLVWPVGTTDRAGRLSLSGDFSRPLDLHLLDAGGQLHSIRLAAAFGDEACRPPRLEVPRLEVPAAARVAGRILAASGGRPLAGALVWPAHDPGRFAVTDAEGSYEVSAAPSERFRIRAEAAGFLPRTGSVSARSGELSRAPALALERVLAAAGNVVDGERRPVAGAEVEVRAPGGRTSGTGSSAPNPGPRYSVTGGRGRFELATVPGRKIDVEVRKNGFSPLLVRGVEVSSGQGEGGVADLGTFVLVPGARIDGRVVDTWGEPVGGAGVWVVAAERQLNRHLERELERRGPDTTTGRDGRFTIEDLEPGRRLHVLIHRPGFLPARRVGVKAPSPELLSVVLEPAARVSGRVVDEAGEGVTHARVEFQPLDPAPGTVGAETVRQNALEVLTDGEGNFVVPGLLPGKARIGARANGFQPGPFAALEIHRGESIEDLILELELGAVVEGWVSSAEGEAVEGARVRIERLSATSDENGFFRLEGVSPGRRSLIARHLEFQDKTVEVEVDWGTNPVEVELEGGWPVTGRVVEATGTVTAGTVGAGGPVAGVSVELRLDGDGALRLYPATSDAEGRFEFPRVVDGVYQLSAGRPGYGTVEIERALEVSGGGVADLKVELPPGVAVVGRLRGLDFEELAVARVEAESGGLETRPGTVDHEGRYEIRDLGPGVWKVEARLPDGHRQAEARITIAPGVRQVRQDLELGGLLLSGQVIYAGVALAEARLALTGTTLALRRSVVSDYEGRFRLADLEPGGYLLSVTHPVTSVTHNEEIELFGPRELTVEITTARLGGVVHSADTREPLADALVRLERLLSSRRGSLITLATNWRGGFTFEGLSPGRYRLSVEAAGYTPHEEVVEVGPDRDGLELALAPTEGLDLVVLLASGRAPARASVSVLDVAGQPILTQTRSVSETGRARFPTVPTGTWDLVVSAPGGATTRVGATVPGPPLELVLAPGDRLVVRVPELVAANLVASLSLDSVDGRPFESVGSTGVLEREWRLDAGTGHVEGVPAGAWILQVEAADGRHWEQSVTTAGGERVEVVVR